jgi:hypothetical protein
MGVLPSGRKGGQAGKKKALKCAFPRSEFFSASGGIFVVLDDQDRSSG